MAPGINKPQQDTSAKAAAATAKSKVTPDTKISQLEQATIDDTAGDAAIKTGFGVKVDNTDTWLSAGSRGPLDISDPHGREKIHFFDHERIPERVVHARGVGAHGTFTLHTPIPEYTSAKILSEAGATCPMFVRFSTVQGSRGSADTVRDVRGFAARFYTQEGNWDIVGNNIPVFFIQDGMKFPDLVHAVKPEPDTEIPTGQSAHDSFWDFISLMPESSHMIAWQLSDRTIPRSLRMMQGFGVNTFLLVTKEGKATYVKFHWTPHLGTHSLLWDEALKINGQDPDYHRRDLYEAIEAGAYPKWELGVQLIPMEEGDALDFDVLDCTKLVPEEMYPVKNIGTLELNRNVTEYFSEVEQVAFCTSHVVPGIDYSNDPMLAVRNFSYLDTQLSRVGRNWQQIPINKPVCPFAGITTIRDGQMNTAIHKGPNYWPNSVGKPHPSTIEEGAMHHVPLKVEGVRARMRGPKYTNEGDQPYNQGTMFYNSMSEVEKEHMVAAACFELGHCHNRGVQERMMTRFAQIHPDFGKAVSEGFGIAIPADATKNRNYTTAKSDLSMLSESNVFTPVGRKIAVMALDGCDGAQAAAVQKAFTAIGLIVIIVGSRHGPVWAQGVTPGDEKAAGSLRADFTPESCRSTYFDALFFPGGDETYLKNIKQGRVKHFAAEAFGHFKAIAVSGNAVGWLAHTVLPGCTDIKADRAEAWTEKNGVVCAPNLVGSDSSAWEKLTGAGSAASFGKAFLDAIGAHRHWGRDVSEIAF